MRSHIVLGRRGTGKAWCSLTPFQSAEEQATYARGRWWRAVLVAGGAWLGAALVGNWRGLAEGLRYLRDLRSWRPAAVAPVRPDGPFGVCHGLAKQDNAGRLARIVAELRAAGLAPDELPVPGELPNLLVRFPRDGPATLLVAHYDKSRETPAYQGAADNTAAVGVLLALARVLAQRPPARAVALLFSSAEERGLLGARAFQRDMGRLGLALESVVNLDMLGRGGLATRPSAPAGIYVWLPLLGLLVYDGRTLRRGQPYPPPDPALLARLDAAAPRPLLHYRRFTAYSDSVVFQAAGLPTVSLSSDDMAYLDRVWERDSDRIELLDERHLALALELLLRLVKPST